MNKHTPAQYHIQLWLCLSNARRFFRQINIFLNKLHLSAYHIHLRIQFVQSKTIFPISFAISYIEQIFVFDIVNNFILKGKNKQGCKKFFTSLFVLFKNFKCIGKYFQTSFQYSFCVSNCHTVVGHRNVRFFRKFKS